MGSTRQKPFSPEQLARISQKLQIAMQTTTPLEIEKQYGIDHAITHRILDTGLSSGTSLITFLELCSALKINPTGIARDLGYWNYQEEKEIPENWMIIFRRIQDLEEDQQEVIRTMLLALLKFYLL